MSEVKDAAYYERIEKFIKTVTPLWKLKLGDTVSQVHLDSLKELLGEEIKVTALGSIYFKDGKPTMRTGEALNWKVEVE